MKHFENIKQVDYCCIHALMEDMLDNLNIGSDEFTTVTVVANEDITKDLLRVFMQVEIDGFEFTPEILDLDVCDYDNLYCFDITNNGEISITKAWMEDNEYHKACYFEIESDLVFLYSNDVDAELINAVHDSNTIIFDFEDSECE